MELDSRFITVTKLGQYFHAVYYKDSVRLSSSGLTKGEAIYNLNKDAHKSLERDRAAVKQNDVSKALHIDIIQNPSKYPQAVVDKVRKAYKIPHNKNI